MVKVEEMLIIGGVVGLALFAILGYAKPPEEVKGEISSVEIRPC